MTKAKRFRTRVNLILFGLLIGVIIAELSLRAADYISVITLAPELQAYAKRAALSSTDLVVIWAMDIGMRSAIGLQVN
jgi:hypothetical protein